MLIKFSLVMQIDQNNSLDSLDSPWILINKLKSHFGDYARKLVFVRERNKLHRYFGRRRSPQQHCWMILNFQISKMNLFENKKFSEEDISVRGELVAMSYRATPLIIEIFKPNLLPVRKRYV